ncbi:hypothetical protein U9K47_18635 [Bacillus toyonensis]|uniref:hypothetical protein n=1 Tax=Bacillus toyonensis TaxID=155322 RepID=UPI00346587B8
MITLKETAEVYRIGLQIELFSKKDVIYWADHTIETLDKPPYEIIEVSSSNNDKLIDVISKLKNIKGKYDATLPLKIILGIIYERFILSGESLFTIKFFLSNLVYNNCCDEINNLHSELYNFNEEIFLAEENIYGDLEAISQKVKRFLSVYKNFSKYFEYVPDNNIRR